MNRIDNGEMMSEATIFNNVVYLSGQVGENMEVGIEEQSKSTLTIIENLLKKSGSGKDKILRATIYLKNMSDYAAFNKVWGEWLPEGTAPARICVEAKLCNEIFLVEVSAIAAIEGEK